MSNLRSYTLNVDVKLVTEECCNCGVLFAITDEMHDRLRKSHDWFYCPNGHSQHYTSKTEEQKLREQLEREKARAASASAAADQARADADHERARANGYKGALTKTKKRIGKGVCPGCNRHFSNVERHMATQHPELAEASS